MTPTEFKEARSTLGLTAKGFAHLVGVSDGRTVRRWEAGDRDIPGPVVLLTKLFMKDGRIMELAKSIMSGPP